MGRASNRKWANRVKRVVQLASSALPRNQRDAKRLLALFGEQRKFLKASAAVDRQVRERRQQVAA